MDELIFAEGLGEAIISKQHQFYVEDRSDDLEYISNIKRIITSMSEYLESEGLPRDGISKVVDNLIQISRDQYLEENLANRIDEGEKEVREESTIFFDYVYEHEEYPR